MRKHTVSGKDLKQHIISVRGLTKHFPIRGGLFNRQIGVIRAVDSVSFDVEQNKTLGIVGESGCGKSTLARLINRLIEPTAGEINFRGDNILAWKGGALRRFRSKIQVVFQDPYASLNPRFSMFDIIEEPLRINKIDTKRARRKRVRELIEKSGLSWDYRNRYPHEFSGGQRQRIGIARALVLHPEILICDEPVSALDVSVQAQILNLLMGLQDEFKLTVLFISHDLSVISKVSDQVIVLYCGKIVEMAPRARIFKKQLHPYAQALFAAIPKSSPHEQKERTLLNVEPPSPRNFPSGCRFHPRCPQAMEVCKKTEPQLKNITGSEADFHHVACHLF